MLTLTLVRESVDEPRVRVEVEHNWLVICEESRVLSLGQTVWVVAIRHELEEVDNVDESDLQVGEVLAEKCSCSERFLGNYIAAGCHDKIWLSALIV